MTSKYDNARFRVLAGIERKEESAMGDSPYRTPDPDTAVIDRLAAVEERARLNRRIILALMAAVAMLALTIPRTSYVDERIDSLAACRVADDAELEARRLAVEADRAARHRLTMEQDQALCERACVSNDHPDARPVSADCRWSDIRGRRFCHCYCRVPLSTFDSSSGADVYESR